MKQRRIDVVCPVLVTTENVTLPMVRTFLEEELDCRDTRNIHMPTPISQEEAYEMVKEALRELDLQLLRERTEGQEGTDETEGDSIGVGWYYGLTKEESDHVVIQATLSQEKREIGFTVASRNWPVVTGMLAELRQNFGQLVREGREKR